MLHVAEYKLDSQGDGDNIKETSAQGLNATLIRYASLFVASNKRCAMSYKCAKSDISNSKLAKSKTLTLTKLNMIIHWQNIPVG